MNRHESRQEAVSLLYEMEFHRGEDMAEMYRVSLEEHDMTDNPFLRDLFFGTVDHLEEIDAVIGENSRGWKVERLSRVARAIMRLCVYELKFREDVPDNVALNEAVELIKEYDDPDAKAFVNGVLNAAAKNADAGKQAATGSEN